MQKQSANYWHRSIKLIRVLYTHTYTKMVQVNSVTMAANGMRTSGYCDVPAAAISLRARVHIKAGTTPISMTISKHYIIKYHVW